MRVGKKGSSGLPSAFDSDGMVGRRVGRTRGRGWGSDEIFLRVVLGLIGSRKEVPG